MSIAFLMTRTEDGNGRERLAALCQVPLHPDPASFFILHQKCVRRHRGLSLQVTLHRPKQLSDYSEEEGRQRLAKGREIIDENLEIPSFHVEAYASIKKAGIMSARLRTFQDVINFVTLTLAVGLRGKLAAFTGKEQTRRQLIAAVLQGAILMAGMP